MFRRPRYGADLGVRRSVLYVKLQRRGLTVLWFLSSNSNVIAATMLVAFHIFQDPVLLSRVRSEIEETLGQHDSLRIDYSHLRRMPLLSSIQAEVLRLYVDVLLIFSSPHEDVSLGKWRLPKGQKALVSTSISHRDGNIWNTMGGLHPLDSFWADRFIIDPTNKSSGPIRPDVRTGENHDAYDKPYFSTRGLEGSWIPFGGELPLSVLRETTLTLLFRIRGPINVSWSFPGQNYHHVYLCPPGKQVRCGDT